MSNEPGKFPELFGSMVFNEDTMKERLSPSCYKQWKKSVSDGTPLDISTANEIAEAMKQWAVEKGATHYTHWFQPMTGVTAEKHDSFISPAEKGKIVLFYSGDKEEAEMKVVLKDSLPRYMVPNVTRKLERIPLTSNGKTDRVALSEMVKTRS